MAKPFYKFGNRPFRDELLDAYLLPVAKWFLRDDSSPYLLPQASGSNWECSLAIEYLMNLSEGAVLSTELSRAIREKVLATGRWLLSQAREQEPGRMAWDGNTWDTAVCMRTVLRLRRTYDQYFSDAEKAELERCVNQSVKWLVEQSLHWDTEIRYAGGPPDLAQVLSALILVAEVRPAVLRSAERGAGVAPDDCVIDQTARVLLAMEETTQARVQQDEEIAFSFWVDAFNSSEVIDALTLYLAHCHAEHRWGGPSHEDGCRKAVYRCLRFIEVNQADGTWGGIADTCGVLFGYLRVTSMIEDVGHEDYVIFKALRWMCDEKQTLSDGSFLHTSYVTVFYALALWQAYASWPLGLRPGSEVYDVALWKTPSQATAERSRRLDLQIEVEDTKRRHERLKQNTDRFRLRVFGALVFIVLSVVTIGVLVISGALVPNWSLSTEIARPELLWAIAAVAVPVNSSITGAVVAIIKNRHGSSSAGRVRSRKWIPRLRRGR